MGRMAYEVVNFDFEYLDDARETLGALFDIGVNEWKVSGEDLTQAFLASGVAEQFERHNPVYVSGKSALDLLRLLAPYLAIEKPLPKRRWCLGKTTGSVGFWPTTKWKPGVPTVRCSTRCPTTSWWPCSIHFTRPPSRSSSKCLLAA